VESAAYSPQGNNIVTWTDDHKVRIWNTETGSCVHTIAGGGDTEANFGITFSPQGNHLACSCNDSAVRVWSVESGECLHTLVGHTKFVYVVVYSPDGTKIATCSADSTIRLWDADTGDCCRTIHEDGERFWKILYSPRGIQIVSMSDTRISLWNVMTGDHHQLTSTDGGETLRSIASTPIGDTIVTSLDMDGSLRLWNAQSGECLHVLVGHDDRVKNAAFSPSGTMMASVSDDRTVRLWNVRSGECLGVMKDLPSAALDVAWGSEGLRTGYSLVALCQCESMVKWDVMMSDEGECQVQLCWRVTRGSLCLKGAKVQDAQGLSDINWQLLQRRGAIGKPAEGALGL
jgi:WD40 repeat protein